MPKPQQGFSLILTTIMLGLVMAYGYMVFSSTLSIQNANKTFERSLTASQLAEAGAHKAIYCLRATIAGGECGTNIGDAYAGENDVTLGDGTFSVSVSGSGNMRSITSVGTAAGGRAQTLKLEMAKGFQSVPVRGFDFAVLLGDGTTFNMGNNSDVKHGSSYIGTDLVCSNGASFNGNDLFNYKSGGKVTGCNDGIRDLHADTLVSDTAVRDAYCKNRTNLTVGRNHLTTCPYSETPAAPVMPSLDTAFWHAKAEAGGTIEGNYTIPNGASFGPKRINGNLYTANNATITLTGPIWVNGDVLFENNATIKLDPALSQSSSIILADSLINPATSGRIRLSNNVHVNSTSDGSYIVLASTNTSNTSTSPAINVLNNTQSVLLWAPFGSVNVSNNAITNAVVAQTLYLDNNTSVDYDNSGITPSNLSIITTNVSDNRWHIKPATWREYW
jgi:hypothetical protein